MNGGREGSYIYAHEYVVFLAGVSCAFAVRSEMHAGCNAYLFVANGKLARGDLVGIRKGLQLLDGIALQYGNGKLDV